MKENESLGIGLAQISPVWMNRDKTIEKVVQWIEKASRKGCNVVVFGESIIPGYPFWLAHTDGARFESEKQKIWFARYVRESVDIDRGDLDPICRAASEFRINVIIGVVERPVDRGGHSLFCSAVTISEDGRILSAHRKLRPTYEERLVWASGDGAGLVTHRIDPFTVGVLNCWENWMPMARTSLYTSGENLHCALWPGNLRNTEKLTPVLAMEGRSYVASVSGVLTKQDIPDDVPYRTSFLEMIPDSLADGGTCLAAPDGQWICEPSAGKEELLTAQISIGKVWQERQNFDPAGHYARPDVFHLSVDRSRQ